MNTLKNVACLANALLAVLLALRRCRAAGCSNR
jgi:hypothetical protein